MVAAQNDQIDQERVGLYERFFIQLMFKAVGDSCDYIYSAKLHLRSDARIQGSSFGRYKGDLDL